MVEELGKLIYEMTPECFESRIKKGTKQRAWLYGTAGIGFGIITIVVSLFSKPLVEDAGGTDLIFFVGGLIFIIMGLWAIYVFRRKYLLSQRVRIYENGFFPLFKHDTQSNKEFFVLFSDVVKVVHQIDFPDAKGFRVKTVKGTTHDFYIEKVDGKLGEACENVLKKWLVV